jgi:malate dehydrogenase (oxaloacetate-decarboxylating)
MDEWEVYPREAVAVGLKAIEQGIAGITASKQELFEKASATIKRARRQAQVLMEAGIIAPAPPDDE